MGCHCMQVLGSLVHDTWDRLGPSGTSCVDSVICLGHSRWKAGKVMTASPPHSPHPRPGTVWWGGQSRHCWSFHQGPDLLTVNQGTRAMETSETRKQGKGNPNSSNTGLETPWAGSSEGVGGPPVCTHRQHPPPLGETPVETAAFKPVAGTGALPAEPNFPEPLVSTLTVRAQMCPRISE